MHIRHTSVLFLLLFIACNAYNERQDIKYASPGGYLLTEPVRYRVRQSMQEISGIVLFPDDKHIMAVNDEEGKIYSIDVRTRKPYPYWKFHKSGDYEDLATGTNKWMVLKSNGTLYHVTDLFTDSTDAVSYKFPLHGKREFESLYFDDRNNSMVAICKSCHEDKGQHLTSAYRFNLQSMQYDTLPAFRISVADIARLSGTDINYFKPSAAAVHPVEKRLYILSSVNRLLVITDMEGKVQEAYNLRHRRFRQPEGITFAPNGDMYISNEAVDESPANILRFRYRPHRTGSH